MSYMYTARDSNNIDVQDETPTALTMERGISLQQYGRPGIL